MATTSKTSLEDEGTSRSSPGFFMRSCTASIKLKFPSVSNITTQVLTEWLACSDDRHVIVLDCRPEEEYVISHIESAIRTDFELTDMTPIVEMCKEKFQENSKPTIVCYCSVGYRSSVLAEKLQKYFDKKEDVGEIPEVYNLEGSLFQWANERRPMIDSNGQPTQFAHPYSAVWGKLLDKPLRKEKL